MREREREKEKGRTGEVEGGWEGNVSDREDARTWCYVRPRELFRTTTVNRIIWFLLDYVMRINAQSPAIACRCERALRLHDGDQRVGGWQQPPVRDDTSQADNVVPIRRISARSLARNHVDVCIYNRSYVFVTFACTQLLVYICYIYVRWSMYARWWCYCPTSTCIIPIIRARFTD